MACNGETALVDMDVTSHILGFNQMPRGILDNKQSSFVQVIPRTMLWIKDQINNVINEEQCQAFFVYLSH